MTIRSFLSRLKGLLLGTAPNSGCNNCASKRLMSGIYDLKILNAKTLISRQAEKGILESIHDAEFKVFSQFGEDGIIQYLIRNIVIAENEKIFVEFGVENYTESNTRFLLCNNNWRGLIIDQSPRNIEEIQKEEISWRHDLKSVCAHITRENINEIISEAGVSGRIGLLSIDIDGNDYWVWEKINCIDPLIVVIEYNSIFGAKHSVAVPYDPSFDRTKAHYSWLYWGASVKAMANLALHKGYALVGANSSGTNLFFVKRESLGALKEKTPAQGFVRSKIRDSRDTNQALSFLRDKEQEAAISQLKVLDTEAGEIIRLSEIFN